MDEATIKEQLDRLLRRSIPTMSSERRRSLIATLPLCLWSIYGGRST